MNSVIPIFPLAPGDREWVRSVWEKEWEANFVVVHNQVYTPDQVSGFKAVQNDIPAGLITYTIVGSKCEIVTINSFQTGTGIGSSLMHAVEKEARVSGCTSCWLVTTNNNEKAIRFYQKLGYLLVEIHKNAVEEARKLKPSIPFVDEKGTPITDELFLEKRLTE